MVIRVDKAFTLKQDEFLKSLRELDEAMSHHKFKIDISEETYREYSRGSQAALRLAGGMLISNEQIPIKVLVRIVTTSGGDREVQISAVDDMGFGARIGMKGKFQAVLEWSYELVKFSLFQVEPSKLVKDIPKPNSTNVVDSTIQVRLKKLDELLKAGVITQSDFDEQKVRVLNEI